MMRRNRNQKITVFPLVWKSATSVNVDLDGAIPGLDDAPAPVPAL